MENLPRWTQSVEIVTYAPRCFISFSGNIIIPNRLASASCCQESYHDQPAKVWPGRHPVLIEALGPPFFLLPVEPPEEGERPPPPPSPPPLLIFIIYRSKWMSSPWTGCGSLFFLFSSLIYLCACVYIDRVPSSPTLYFFFSSYYYPLLSFLFFYFFLSIRAARSPSKRYDALLLLFAPAAG